MFKTTFKSEPTRLEEELDRLLIRLSYIEPDTDEYNRVADQLSKLYKLKETDSKQRMSRDVMAGVAGNLAGILLILGYEHAHAVGSKALGFVMKAVK